MPRKRSPTLTEGELRIMKALWSSGPGTVAEVQARLKKPRSTPAYSTVLTILRILEAKGCVRHTKEGRAFVYEAVLAPAEARRNVLRFVLRRFFDGSPRLLVQNLLEHGSVDEEQIAELRRLIEQPPAPPARRRPSRRNEDEAR